MESVEQSAPLALKLDGPSVGLDTVDAEAALRLASAYIGLLARVAEEQLSSDLRFESLHVKSGSLELVTRAVPAFIAPEADAIVAGYEAGASIPRGMKGAWDDYNRSILELPPGYLARRFLAGEERQLLSPIQQGAEPSWGSLSVRARLLRVGGKSPTARFESDSEAAPFSLELSHEMAREISRHLYEELDLDATVQRDGRRMIVAGDLQEFIPVPDESDAFDAWRRWYRENGCYWDRPGAR